MTTERAIRERLALLAMVAMFSVSGCAYFAGWGSIEEPDPETQPLANFAYRVAIWNVYSAQATAYVEAISGRITLARSQGLVDTSAESQIRAVDIVVQVQEQTQLYVDQAEAAIAAGNYNDWQLRTASDIVSNGARELRLRLPAAYLQKARTEAATIPALSGTGG